MEGNILHWNDIHIYVKYDGAICLSTHTFNTKAKVHQFTEGQTFSLFKGTKLSVSIFKTEGLTLS